MIKRLLINSVKLRNLPMLSSHASLQKCDYHSSGIPKKVTTQPEILDIDKTLGIMNTLHSANSNGDVRNLVNHPKFISQCERLQNNIRYFNNSDVIKVLKTLLFFNVPAETRLIQELLQMLRASVNELSVKEILQLDSILSKLEVPLAKGLLEALPHVFELAVKKISSDNQQLLKALKYAIKNDLNVKLHIGMTLLQSQRKLTPQDLMTLFNIIYCLPHMDTVSERFLTEIKNRIIMYHKQFDLEDLSFLLELISKKVQVGETQFYSKRLVNVIVVLHSKHGTVLEKCRILILLNRMRHSQSVFLKFLPIDFVNSNLPMHMDEYIKAYTISGYPPYSLNQIEMLATKFYSEPCTRSLLLESNKVFTAYNLLSLHYCPKLLDNVFSWYQSNYHQIKDENVHLTVLKLHGCVNLLYPEYGGFKLDENVVKEIKFNEKRNVVPSLLLETLATVIGGKEYIMNDLKTSFGVHIDHVVLIQPNGLPMNVSNNMNDIKFVEDLISLSECKKILFLMPPEEIFCIQTRTTLSTFQMEMKAIETLKDFYTFPICPSYWTKLSPDEQVYYLQDYIKTKSDMV